MAEFKFPGAPRPYCDYVYSGEVGANVLDRTGGSVGVVEWQDGAPVVVWGALDEKGNVTGKRVAGVRVDLLQDPFIAALARQEAAAAKEFAPTGYRGDDLCPCCGTAMVFVGSVMNGRLQCESPECGGSA